MNKIIEIGLLNDETFAKRLEQTRRVISPDGLCGTLTAAMGGGGGNS